jgi:hypothetical protein
MAELASAPELRKRASGETSFEDEKLASDISGTEKAEDVDDVDDKVIEKSEDVALAVRLYVVCSQRASDMRTSHRLSLHKMILASQFALFVRSSLELA